MYFILGSNIVIADADLNFHGTLQIVECVINNGDDQIVDFGNVGIHKIDGARYKKEIPLALVCKNYSGGKIPSMKLTIEGVTTSFNEAAVSTNVDGLGIEILSNDVPSPLNKKINLDYYNLPNLKAVPILKSGANPTAQDFKSSIKLTVEVD